MEIIKVKYLKVLRQINRPTRQNTEQNIIQYLTNSLLHKDETEKAEYRGLKISSSPKSSRGV